MAILRPEDVRLAVRRLRKHTGATIASVAALACGIGATIATWSLLSSVLLNPLPVEAPERLFQVDMPGAPGVSGDARHSYTAFESLRDSTAFDGIAASGNPANPMLVIEQGDMPQRRQVYFANHDFFATLGISAARGRTFTENDDRRGALPVAVLSDHYWRSVFNADPNVLGRTVTISGTPATIVGILPRGFRGLHLSEAPDLYLPLHVVGDIDNERLRASNRFGSGSLWIRIVGRLHLGVGPDAVAAQLNAMDCACPAERTNGEVGPIFLTNINTAAVPTAARPGMSQFATLLSITVCLLLMAGCLTVGMLLLVRTEDRRDELAICLSLGATRSRLAAGVGIEAAMLCTLGAVLGVPIALWLFYGIRAFALPGGVDIERLELTLAPGPWLAVTGAALAATCVIAMLASLVGAGIAASSPLQSRSLATPRVTRQAPRTMLVAGQVAITLVLVTGAGLFTRSMIEALHLNSAVATDRIVTVGISLAEYGYAPERAEAFVDELRERLRQNGNVESVAIRQNIGSNGAGTSIVVDGVPQELPSVLGYTAVENDFFSTIGLPIVSGRSFERSNAASAPLVAIVSESLGRLIAHGGDPVGRRISDWGSFRRVLAGEPPVYAEVIGVVPDLIINVNTTEPLAVYHPITPDAAVGLRGTTLVLRAVDDADAMMRDVIATARALDPSIALGRIQTLDDQIAGQMNPQRFGIYVLGVLGGIALLLTALGTYVIAESMVVRRRREMSIRAALGAGSAQLRRLVLSDTARLVGIGLVAGLVLAVLGARLIRSLLYQVEPLDPMVLAAVSAVIFGVTLLVSMRPALEASRLDLTRSLREE